MKTPAPPPAPSPALGARLDRILGRIIEPGFLARTGLGNEIACHIFDYPAEEELAVRAHTAWLRARLASHHPELRVLHLNLLDTALAYLRARNLLDRTLEMQRTKGPEAALKALRGPLSAERLRDFIAETHAPASYDLIILDGIGSIWPLVRAHSLLSALHTVIDHTPLILFYPGVFDGITLRLFGRIAPADNATGPGARPYYRGFILVPHGAQP